MKKLFAIWAVNFCVFGFGAKLRVDSEALMRLADPNLPVVEPDCKPPTPHCELNLQATQFTCRFEGNHAEDMGPYQLNIPVIKTKVTHLKTESGIECFELDGQLVEDLEKNSSKEAFKEAKENGCFRYDFWKSQNPQRRAHQPNPASQDFAFLASL